MKYFIRCKDVAHPGKFFEAKTTKQAAEMVRKEMQDFLKTATMDQLVMEISKDEIDDFFGP